MSDFPTFMSMSKPALVNLANEAGLYPTKAQADSVLKTQLAQELAKIHREAVKLGTHPNVVLVVKAHLEELDRKQKALAEEAEARKAVAEAEVQLRAKTLLSELEKGAQQPRRAQRLTSGCTTKAEVADMRRRRRKNNQARYKNRNRPRGALTAGPEPLPSPVYIDGKAYAFTRAERQAFTGTPFAKLPLELRQRAAQRMSGS